MKLLWEQNVELMSNMIFLYHVLVGLNNYHSINLIELIYYYNIPADSNIIIIGSTTGAAALLVILIILTATVVICVIHHKKRYARSFKYVYSLYNICNCNLTLNLG